VTSAGAVFSEDDAIEVIHPGPARPVRAVLFDFDGTLSMLRAGWARIMEAQMMAELRRAGDRSAEHNLVTRIRAGILANNGRPTVWQMRFLAEEVRARGVQPRSPEEYLADFLARLLAVVGARRVAITSGRSGVEAFTVPGALPLLADLRARGIPLVLASGTDRPAVVSEAELLGVANFFGPDLHAPIDEDPSFSKRAVIEVFLRQTGIPGEGLVGFGDGVVETQEVKRVGGRAIGVACSEEEPGQLDHAKRAALIEAGADVVITDYRSAGRLLSWLGA
jgi:phosphoglycolate phosphatase-like HAD superfamily hydrolase